MADPRLLVKLGVDADRFAYRLDKVAEALGEFRGALAMTTLPSAETYVAGLPRIHYADHLTEQREGGTDG